MNPENLDKNYHKLKKEFHAFIDSIKRTSPWDLYTVINTTLIKNPYMTAFPLKFFQRQHQKENLFFLFLKRVSLFYARQLYSLASYSIAHIIYRTVYRYEKTDHTDAIGLDVFFLADNIIRDGILNESYFDAVYSVFEKHHQTYIFLPRLYGITRNPFKLIALFRILDRDDRNFLFEFELLRAKNILSILHNVTVYPFKTLRLLQKNATQANDLFNAELIRDIASQSFDAFSRYEYGKNIAEFYPIASIYSWSEFQVVERSFNYGIRQNHDEIFLTGCQFYLSYETYFNTFVDDLDYDMRSSPHKVLVNGQYYILDRKKVQYSQGVSLRYKNLFDFGALEQAEYTLLLGSYIEQDTKYMLESVESLGAVVFKNHPAVDIKHFGKLHANITVEEESIYALFRNAGIVIGTASGTAVEAVACGLSVIVMASQENLTANPLVDYGKGKIWDIAFNKDDVKILYNKLIEYRKNNIDEIQEIASWYKENFFVEPTEENIVKVFELEKNI